MSAIFPRNFGTSISILLLLVMLLAGCAAPAPEIPGRASATAIPPRATAAPTRSPPTPTASATAVPATSTAAPTAPPPLPAVCAPLAELDPASLPEHITNPFAPPPPGSDDPHQGIDIADFLPGTRVAIAGRPVQAVLAGVVAGLVVDAFPYGNAVLIETGAANAPAAAMPFPTPLPGLPLHTTLTCPGTTAPQGIAEQRSLYVLYAHLLAAPDLAIGQPVACGEVIGAVGQSGNALNPHLHLEVRVGPAGADLSGMSHYNPSASSAAMDAYCTWRVSGFFQVIDPRQLWSAPID